MGIPLPRVWDPNCEVLEACDPLLAKGENSRGFTPDDCYHGKKRNEWGNSSSLCSAYS